MGSICWSSPAGSENMTQRCGPRSAAVSRGLVSASTQHEIDLWKTPSAIQHRVVRSACCPRKKTRRSPPIPGNSPRLFRDSHLNLSLLKKCDPRIWIVNTDDGFGTHREGKADKLQYFSPNTGSCD